MTNFIKAAVISATAIFAAPAIADTVTLKSADEAINVTGDLVGYNGSEYIVLSTVGLLVISANDVRCEGAGCRSQADAITSILSANLTSGASGALAIH